MTTPCGSVSVDLVKPILKFFLGILLVAPTFAEASSSVVSYADPLPQNIPVNPDRLMTPGELCTKGEATELRYPEKIYYCARKVSTEMKEAAYDVYDRKYGLRSKGFPRTQFKMDHLISLCMGGSNDITNLWPQHLKVSEMTDKIENLLCIMMQKGRMKQKDAVETILRVKMNLDLAPEVQARLILETQ